MSDILKASYIETTDKTTGEVTKRTFIPPEPSDGDLGGISEEDLKKIDDNGRRISQVEEDLIDYQNDIIIYNNHSVREISGSIKLREEEDYFMVCIPKNKYIFAYFNLDSCNDIIAVLGENLSYTDESIASEYENGKNLYNSIAGKYLNNPSENNYYVARTFDKRIVAINDLICTGIGLKKKKMRDYDQFASIHQTENLFNVNTEWYPCECYGNNSNIRYSNSYLCSELIEINSEKLYYTNFHNNNIDNIRFAEFDENLNAISSKKFYDDTSYANNVGVKFSNEAKYICIIIKKDITKPKETNYISIENYKKIPEMLLLAYKSVPTERLNGIAKHLWIPPQNTSIYYRDKKFVFEGDSLTATGSGSIYAIATCRELGITKYKNTAVGGTAMEGKNTGNNGAIVSDDRINKYPLDSDYIVIMCGTNGEGDIGELTLANSDIDTFIGAFNVWLSKVYYKFKQSDGYYANVDYSQIEQAADARDIKIILITPPQGYSVDILKGVEGKLKKRGDAMIEMGRLWGIPVLDSMKAMQMNVFNCTKYYGDKTHFGQRSHFMLANGLIGLLRQYEPVEHDDSIISSTKY